MASRSGPSLPTLVAIGALALFGAVVLVQWLIAGLLGFAKLVLALVVLVAVAGAVLSAKGRR